MGRELTNLFTYVLIIFFVILFVAGIQQFATYQLQNDKASLSDDSVIYLGKILDPEFVQAIEKYNVTGKDVAKNDLDLGGNETGSSLKDFALEFFYAKSQAKRMYNTAKQIFVLPSFFTRLLDIDEGPIQWILTILNTFWSLALLFAGLYFIRGIIT